MGARGGICRKLSKFILGRSQASTFQERCQVRSGREQEAPDGVKEFSILCPVQRAVQTWQTATISGRPSSSLLLGYQGSIFDFSGDLGFTYVNNQNTGNTKNIKMRYLFSALQFALLSCFFPTILRLHWCVKPTLYPFYSVTETPP